MSVRNDPSTPDFSAIACGCAASNDENLQSFSQAVLHEPAANGFDDSADSAYFRTSLRRKVAAVKSFCKWLDGEGLLDSALIETLTPARRTR